MSASNVVATVVKDAKTVVTVLGAAVAALNEIVGFVPANDQHWVTGAVLVLTVIARDITDAVANVPKS